MTGSTGDVCTNSNQIMVPLKYLSNFWRILEMNLNCEITIHLTGSANCVVYVSSNAANQATTLANICNNQYKPLLSNCKLINSRQCKATSTIKIRF